jgi:hypothetical protein
VGNTLCKILLEDLVKAGILELHREDETMLRWNRTYAGYWERKSDNTA